MPLPTTLKLRLKQLLALMRAKAIGTHVDAILTQGYNGLLLVPPDDFSIGRQLAFRGEYNREEIERMGRLLTPESRVLIVGAHVGAVLIPLAKLVSGIVGVEANPDTFKLLSQNVALNGLNNVRLIPIAASDAPGELEFLLSRVNSGGSKVRPSGRERNEFFYDHPMVQKVAADRLDDVLSDGQFDFVLMDIEGSEYRALLGMQQLLANVSALVLEVLPNHIENVAGVSAEQFLSAIPDTFEDAEPLVTDSQGGRFTRDNFPDLFERVWHDEYFDGCDVLFTRRPPDSWDLATRARDV